MTERDTQMRERLERLRDRTHFEPEQFEPQIVERWLASGLFHAEPGEGVKVEEAGPEGAVSGQETYSIAIPPPNVTGSLHMGHALNSSIQDVLIRRSRMRGMRTKWILGTDHAGIATQAKVEKMLAEEGTSRIELGREAFLRRVWEWREHYGGTIVSQLKRLGASCDYSEERFTLDEDYAHAVVEVFVALYEKGYIYKDRYIVNWDPGSRSAISDLEVEEREEQDTLYSIVYDLEGGGTMTIATVRPETMLADTAVAVNPGDERYRDLVGRIAILPLVGRRLPVIADEYVKTDFGTGQLKITPAHDPNDFEIGVRHGLPQISVIGEDGRLSDEAGEAYAGMTVLEARTAVVEALEREGRIVAREPYTHNVPYSHRSGQRIEPLISLQWFMRMDELAAPAIEAVKSGQVRILPESQRKVYLDWMAEIRPWCISRQLWWGHRIPAWACEGCGAVQVLAQAPREGCGECGGRLLQEEDVLDTWFSSALWPFATLGWPRDTPQLRSFYPTNVLSTARDILFLWVARMVMMGIEFTGQAPFSDVYIHSVIQAPDGRRMSKSLGTGVDPVAEIERDGADAVRFGLLAMSSGQDVRYSAEKVKQGHALANKLFNATRFALLRIAEQQGLDFGELPQEPRPQTIEDRWILSRLQRVKAEVNARIDAYDFSHAALALYDFVYSELCDWYLEWIKPRLAMEDRERGSAASREQGSAAALPADELERREALAATLLSVLRETVALSHPVIPFVTEELWSYLGGEGLLAGAAWPQVREELIDPEAEASVARAIEAVTLLRGWRDSVSAPVRKLVPARLAAAGYEATAGAVAALAKLELADRDGEAPVVAVPIPGGTVEVLSAEGLDLDAAQRRRSAARERLQQDIERVQRKLANAGFVEKAPAEVVAAERAKLEKLEAELEAL